EANRLSRRYAFAPPMTLTLAPTADVLAGAYHAAREVNLSNAVIVAPMVAAADKSLSFAEREVAMVQTRLPGATLLRAEATKARAREALRDAELVHSACHGRADPMQPLASSIELANGEVLRVADLLNESFRPRRLAVLSACETSAAGLVAPTES